MSSPAQSNLHDTNRLRIPLNRGTRVPFNGLLTNKLLSALPGADFARLLPYLEPTSFRTGEQIYELGQEIVFVCFPETLIISQLCYLEDGSSTGVSTVGSDGLLGLSAILASQRAQYWAVATIGGSALRIRVAELKREFVRGGAVQNLVFSYASARLSQLAQRVVCNSRHGLEERLCTWLLMIQDRAHVGELPLTHEAISQHLGTRRAGITNFCNVLRDNGVISYHRAMITILDRQALKESACECYQRLS